MATPASNASSKRGNTARTDTRRARMAWFEHGSTRIYFEVQGSGDPILLIPGFAVSIEEFSGLRDSLVMAGYQVIAADLPGSGRSEPQPRKYTASFHEEDAQAFTGLLQHLESDHVHLVGYGDGGEICLLIAALMPELARSVVTWGTTGVINDPSGQLREVICNVVDDPIPPLQQFGEHLASTYGEEQAHAMARSMATAWSTIIEQNGGDISRSKADLITCPALLIAGEHDIFAPPTLVSKLAASIRTAEVLVVEGAEQFAYMDHPEWLSHAILEWLGKHPG